MDCLKGLKTLPDNSVDCCVTSPPYYGLRDYGIDGQIGLEETPEAYIVRLLEVFMEVYRVLKKTGTLWVVIGDSYNGSGKNNGKTCKNGWKQRTNTASHKTKPTFVPGLKRKDIIGIPWMLAFELRRIRRKERYDFQRPPR
jgi:DNA modification methylase